ncbi:MAG: MFS transporter [Planctomycetaceae bacterium]|jgi:predicted MFS family arabinose efflux permease|nr:MFS transporter [Planctomycetaceae bacterium]
MLSITRVVIFGQLVAVSLLFWFGAIPDFGCFYTTSKLSYPTFTVADRNGYYVIDKFQCRVVAADSQGNLRFSIDGRQHHSQGFFYAIDILPRTDGGFYLLNGIPNEQYEYFIRESILQYDNKGRFVKTIYTLEHDPAKKENVLVNHGRIKYLHYGTENDQTLSWFELYNDRVVQCHYNVDSGKSRPTQTTPITQTIFQFPPTHTPDRDIADITSFGDSFVWTKKNGQIIQHTEKILYDYSSATLTNNQPVPWELDTDQHGNIYFVDLKGRSIICVAPDKSQKTVFRTDQDIYRINVSPDGIISTATASEIYLIDTIKNSGEIKSYSEFIIVQQDRFVLFIQCFAWLIILTIIPYLCKLIYVFLLGKQFRITLLISLLVIVTVVITALIAFFGTISQLVKINEDNVYQHISLLAFEIANSLDGDKLEQINKIGDYYNKNYHDLRNDLDSRFDINQPLLSGYLYAVYTVKNNRLFAQIYQDTTVNTAFPFDWFDDLEQGYSQAWNGELFVSTSTDISGDWIYALAPIRNQSQEVVGILEVSRELFTFRNANRQLLQKLLLETGIFLIIMVLVLIELIFAVNLIRQHNRAYLLAGRKILNKTEAPRLRKSDLDNYSPCYLTRSLVFLYFIADSISLSFLPLMMKSFYHEIPGISESIVLAIPYTVIMFTFGIGSIIAGIFSSPQRLRFLMYAGFLCSSLGFLLAAFSFDMLSFTLSQALVGLGGGLTFITIRQVVLLETDVEKSELGYAHFYAGWTAGVNVGIILGAVIADQFGYSVSFFTAFGVMILCVLFEQFQLSEYVRHFSNKIKESIQNSNQEKIKEKKRNPFKTVICLLRDPQVLTLFLCNTIPTYIIVAFSYYYFPIFADRHGISISMVGIVLLAAGLFTVYLGPPLTSTIRRFLTHEQSVYFTATLWVCCTLFFVFTGSYFGAVMTILALGICDGFAEPCLNYYYLSLRGVREVGEENAIAYYELVSRLGQAFGPIIFASALMFGERTGIGLTALVCIICTGIIYLVNRRYATNRVKNS